MHFGSNLAAAPAQVTAVCLMIIHTLPPPPAEGSTVTEHNKLLQLVQNICDFGLSWRNCWLSRKRGVSSDFDWNKGHF